MAVKLAPEILDANDSNAISAALALTDETLVTLYVFHETGTKNNYRTILQASPIAAGAKWRQVGSPINGAGSITVRVSADRVKAKMLSPEGSISTVEIHIVAK